MLCLLLLEVEQQIDFVLNARRQHDSRQGVCTLTTLIMKTHEDVIMLAGVFGQVKAQKVLCAVSFSGRQSELRVHHPKAVLAAFFQSLERIHHPELKVHAATMAKVPEEGK